MSILHTVNKSPYEKSSLTECVGVAKAGSTILLIEDGVYAAVAGGSAAAQLASLTDVKICALGSDLKARGVADKLADGIEVVDYTGFVELATANDKVQSWL
jgi:tRNA 2-thiouridine synthesizing protein B